MFGTLQPTANSFRDQLKANNNVVRASSLPMSVPGGWPSDGASRLAPGTPLPRESTDNSSAYWSTRSRFSFRSIFTRDSLWSDSTGFRSQNGATWRQELVRNMNSGFGPGAPRDSNYRGVQEGRERGGLLPRLRGVGRLGKPPIRVPDGLAEVAKVRSNELTLSRFEELKDWMADMDKELMSSSLVDEGPKPFVVNPIIKDLYALQAEWQRAYDEMHGEQGSELEDKIEEYRVGPELYHRAAIGAIREDILAYTRVYGKKKYSKEEKATHQKQLAGMKVALERTLKLPTERKAMAYLRNSRFDKSLEEVDSGKELRLLSNQIAGALPSGKEIRLGQEDEGLKMIDRWTAEIGRLETEVQDREAIATSATDALKRLNNVKLDLVALKAEINKLVANETHLKTGKKMLEDERRYQRARRIALIKELLKFDDEVRLIDGEAHGLQSYTTKPGHPNSLRQLLQDYEESPVAHTSPYTG